MIKVLVVDDENMIRTVLRTLVDAESDMRVVGETGYGDEVADLVSSLAPDVVLMDVRLPDTDGITVTERIVRTADPAPKIIVLTIFDSDGFVYGALRAGAVGFLLKRTAPENIVSTVRLAATSDTLLFPEAVRNLAHAHAEAAKPGLAHAGLTEREGDVLRQLALGRSNEEIAGALHVSVGTVKTHVGNVLAKLQARDRTQAVVLAYESGFVTTSSAALG